MDCLKSEREVDGGSMYNTTLEQGRVTDETLPWSAHGKQRCFDLPAVCDCCDNRKKKQHRQSPSLEIEYDP